MRSATVLGYNANMTLVTLQGSAADLTLPTESKPNMPYVMASGTWWAHVMIEH
jgi:hypothetical protein